MSDTDGLALAVVDVDKDVIAKTLHLVLLQMRLELIWYGVS